MVTDQHNYYANNTFIQHIRLIQNTIKEYMHNMQSNVLTDVSSVYYYFQPSTIMGQKQLFIVVSVLYIPMADIFLIVHF